VVVQSMGAPPAAEASTGKEIIRSRAAARSLVLPPGRLNRNGGNARIARDMGW
jgi:hypothetical protein